jgi:hypothetical protein
MKIASVKKVASALVGMAAIAPLGAAGCAVEAEETGVGREAVSSCSVLILGSTVVGGASSDEAQAAAALGCAVTVVDPATWATMTASQFASYTALILGDPQCTTGPGPVAAAVANSGVWGPVVNGNVITAGNDPEWHHDIAGNANAFTFTQDAVAYAVAKPGQTGAYISLSCYYYNSSPGTPVPVLSPFGSFTARGVGGYDVVHKESGSTALANLTDAQLSGWGASLHETFDGFPSGGAPSFIPIAIADRLTGPGAITFPDGHAGVPAVLTLSRLDSGCVNISDHEVHSDGWPNHAPGACPAVPAYTFANAAFTCGGDVNYFGYDCENLPDGSHTWTSYYGCCAH